MRQMEIPDYINERPYGQKCSRDTNQTERRIIKVLFIGFGLLCIIQAILNVSLRLTLYSSKDSPPSDCNATHFCDQNKQKEMESGCEQKMPDHCNNLQERFNALTRDKNLIENKNTELSNIIKTIQEERDRLKMMLMGQNICVSSQRCPADWSEINSRCYFLSSQSKTWEDSRQDCKSKGADLVVINSEQEQKALYRLNGEAVLLTWIGLYSMGTGYKWVDGSMLTDKFWYFGQPQLNYFNNRKECVEMYHLDPELANWNNAPCEQQKRWLCEKDPCISS